MLRNRPHLSLDVPGTILELSMIAKAVYFVVDAYG
jgi:hypothetical protein